MNTERRPRVAVSACLMGEPVRYDGGVLHGSPVEPTWHQYLELIPVCPEVEVGMGVPREPIDLLVVRPERPSGRQRERQREEQRAEETTLRVVGRTTGRDWTETLDAHAASRVEALCREGVCGVILKSRSPSCGKDNVKVHGPGGVVIRGGTGRFAAMWERLAPEVPAIQDDELGNAWRRDAWIEAVFFLDGMRARRFAPQRIVWQLMLHGLGDTETEQLVACCSKPTGTSRNGIHDAWRRRCMEVLHRRPSEDDWKRIGGRFLSRYGNRLSDGARRMLEREVCKTQQACPGRTWSRMVDVLQKASREVGDPMLAGQSLWNPWPGERALRET